MVFFFLIQVWVLYFKRSFLGASPVSLPQSFLSFLSQASLNTAPASLTPKLGPPWWIWKHCLLQQWGNLFLQFFNDDSSTCQSSFLTPSWSTEAWKVWLCKSGSGVWKIARGYHRLPGKLLLQEANCEYWCYQKLCILPRIWWKQGALNMDKLKYFYIFGILMIWSGLRWSHLINLISFDQWSFYSL